jgi:putative endopeptidase
VNSTISPGVNFGGIGAVVGHELTHGFDDLGSKFDERGNVHDWQTRDDRKNFAEKTSCAVAEYSQFGAMPVRSRPCLQYT